MTNAPEITTTREQQLLNGKNFRVFIYNRTESVSGLHQYDHHGFTLVSAGCYFQGTNSKRVLLEWGDSVFISLGSYYQSFYEFGATRILNIGISKRFSEQYYLPLLPYRFVASQVYRTNSTFLTYVGIVISSLNFREAKLEEFVGMVTFYVTNHLRHYREKQAIDDILQWLESTIEKMYGREQSSESTLENMMTLSARSWGCLTRATQRCYDKTPMQIINEIRINFVKKQLEMISYLVADIALGAGYSSPSLFIRTFEKLTSSTPKSYRKKLTGFDQ